MYSFGVFVMMLVGNMRVIEGQENCEVPGSSSSICSQLDLHGVEFNISGLQPGQQSTGCLCDLTFNDSSHVDGPIAINATANVPAGCQYEVYFIHNSTTMRYSCKVFELMYTLNVAIQDKLQMILVSGERSAGGFQFCFKISTEPELNMHLVCNETNTTGMIPSTTTTEIMSSTSTTTTELMPDTTVSSPSTNTAIMTETTASNTSTTTTEIMSDTTLSSVNGMTPTTTAEIIPDTTVPISTQSTTNKRVTDQNTNLTSTVENNDIVQSKLGVIIGGSVGGLTVIIVIIIIILCVIRRKDKT